MADIKIPLLTKIDTNKSRKETQSQKLDAINKTLTDSFDFIGVNLEKIENENSTNFIKSFKLDTLQSKEEKLFYKKTSDDLKKLYNLLLNDNNKLIKSFDKNSGKTIESFDEVNDSLKSEDSSKITQDMDTIEDMFEFDKKQSKKEDDQFEESMGFENKKFLSEQTRDEAKKNLESLGGPIGMIGNVIAKSLGKDTFLDVFTDFKDTISENFKNSKNSKKEKGKEISDISKKTNTEEDINKYIGAFDKKNNKFDMDNPLFILDEHIQEEFNLSDQRSSQEFNKLKKHMADLEQLGYSEISEVLGDLNKMQEGLDEELESLNKTEKQSLKETKSINKKTQSDWLTQILGFAPSIIMLLMNKGFGGLMKDIGGIFGGLGEMILSSLPGLVDGLIKGIAENAPKIFSGLWDALIIKLPEIQSMFRDAIVDGIGGIFGKTPEDLEGIKKILGGMTDSFNPLKIIEKGGKVVTDLTKGDVLGALKNTAEMIPGVTIVEGVIDAIAGKKKPIKDGIISKDGQFWEPSENDTIIATNKNLKLSNMGQYSSQVESRYDEISSDYLKDSSKKQDITNEILQRISEILDKKNMGNSNIIQQSNIGGSDNGIDFNRLRLLGT